MFNPIEHSGDRRRVIAIEQHSLHLAGKLMEAGEMSLGQAIEAIRRFERDCAEHPAMEGAAMLFARRALAELCSDGVCEMDDSAKMNAM